METNEQAQAILELIHDGSGRLLAASRDGKIDTKELISIGLGMMPGMLALAGVEAAGK